MLLRTYQVFSSLVGDLHFFCAFFLQFYGVLFFWTPDIARFMDKSNGGQAERLAH